MLLELAGHRTLDAPVSGVVRPHRELVDEKAVSVSKSSTASTPVTSELLSDGDGDGRGHCRAFSREIGAGAMTSTQMPSL